MKKILIFMILSPFSCFGSQLFIDHPCTNNAILDKNEDLQFESETVFSFTRKLIIDNKIDSKLANDGVISIFNYLTKEKSLEVVGENKFRAYGWCYSINGEIPDIMPDQVKINNKDVINWFLSFSTYDNGNWIDYCVPVKSSKDAIKFTCE